MNEQALCSVSHIKDVKGRQKDGDAVLKEAWNITLRIFLNLLKLDSQIGPPTRLQIEVTRGMTGSSDLKSPLHFFLLRNQFAQFSRPEL